MTKPETESTKTEPIRQQLERWVEENRGRIAKSFPPDISIYGGISNDLARTQSSGSAALNNLRSTEEADIQGGGPEADPASSSLNVVGVDARSPGDLVELQQSGSRVSMLAIYLGHFGERNHFYAENGRWITAMAFSPYFSVANFVDIADLTKVLGKIPMNATPDQFDNWRDQELGPSRADGAKLIEKMTEFRVQAERTYQVNLNKLDAARSILANSTNIRYFSLEEMAGLLLPESAKEDKELFPAPALYAVYTAIQKNEAGFTALSPSSAIHKSNHLYEILSQSQITALEKVALMVREYTGGNMKLPNRAFREEMERTAMGRFVSEAKKALKISRAQREPTPFGILKPSEGVTLEKAAWSPASKEILAFLEHWASYGLFSATSRFHAYGALILRSLDSYPDALLDQRTAWTFLQEVGIINPWEIPSRYRVRLPSTQITRGGGLERDVPQQIEDSKRPDIAAGARTEHNKSTIFCIDAPSTSVIDDGISLERTDKQDEFWIHVHAADPASGIKPNSELGKFMDLIPETIYLPGHFQAMLPSDMGEDEKDFKVESLIKQYSLRSGSPALTFSAKVNTSGEVLDTKIEPTTLGEVVYIDPDLVSEFCNEPTVSSKEGTHLTVGTRPKKMPFQPERDMITPESLPQDGKDDLLTLYNLSTAIKQKRLDKGAWPYFFPRPSVSVAFDKSTTSSESTPDNITIPADPYISVGASNSSGSAIVSTTMVLAGEIAARWCSSRNIPIPYRRDVRTSTSYPEALSYATSQIYPLIAQGIEPSPSHRQELSRITGGIEISSSPGPYFLLGLDMYAKATSPLRRFSDLLVHWQIHAALAHQRATNSTLPADLDTILPFTTADMNQILPLLQMREKMGRTIARGIQDWILIALVRAWQFDKSAPTKFIFTLDSRWRGGLLGRLDLFGLNAALDTQGLHGIAVIGNVQINDRFEVELADVNVHSGQILVKALRHMSRAEAAEA